MYSSGYGKRNLLLHSVKFNSLVYTVKPLDLFQKTQAEASMNSVSCFRIPCTVKSKANIFGAKKPVRFIQMSAL